METQELGSKELGEAVATVAALRLAERAAQDLIAFARDVTSANFTAAAERCNPITALFLLTVCDLIRDSGQDVGPNLRAALERMVAEAHAARKAALAELKGRAS